MRQCLRLGSQMPRVAKDRKSVVALFTAKHILANSDILNELAVQYRLHFLNETVRQFIWERIIETLASEYLMSKRVPRTRRMIKVIRDEMSALLTGTYDEEFDIKW